MDVMRTISSFMGMIEPEDKNHGQNHIAIRLLALFPTALMYWYHYSHNEKRINVETMKHDTIAVNFLKLLHQSEKVNPH
jgi:2-methylcitrate synthase